MSKEEQVKEKLTKDIKEFCHLFGRKPTIEEVLEWAKGIYHYHLDGAQGLHSEQRECNKKWAKDLINKANWGMKVKNEHKRTDFILFGPGIQVKKVHLPDPNYEMNYEEAKCIY